MSEDQPSSCQELDVKPDSDDIIQSTKLAEDCNLLNIRGDQEVMGNLRGIQMELIVKQVRRYDKGEKNQMTSPPIITKTKSRPSGGFLIDMIDNDLTIGRRPRQRLSSHYPR